MFQLKFDKNLKITEEISDYWKDPENIPEEVQDFIKDISNTRVIQEFDTDKFYCPICFNYIGNDKNNLKCNNHQETIEFNFEKSNCLEIDNLEYLKYFQEDFHYYVFDISMNQVFLYIINENIYFNNPNTYKPKMTRKLSILKVYTVIKNELRELLENKCYSFSDIDLKINQEENYDYNLDEELNDYFTSRYLYPNNIKELKNTIFYYSHIWDIGDYALNIIPSICNLLFAPLYYKDFEYLIKNRLYNLAFDKFYLIDYSKNKKLFQGKYLEFLQNNNCDYTMYKALELSNSLDIDVINFISEYLQIFTSLKEEYNLKITEVVNYFREEKLEDEYIREYYDYIEWALKLGFNLKDKKVIFPKDFFKEHDKLANNIMIFGDKTLNERIKKTSNILMLNYYEDDKYIIRPANSITDMIMEGRNQNNCVRTYANRYSNNKTEIYFLREKANLDKSLVTIEVCKGKIQQARCKNNKLVTDKEILKVLKKWERNLIKIEGDN